MPVTNKHILIIPSEYNTPLTPHGGQFIYDQAKALAGLGVKVGVIYPFVRSALRFSGEKKNMFIRDVATEENMVSVIEYCWRIPSGQITSKKQARWHGLIKKLLWGMITYLGGRLFHWRAKSMLRDYIQNHGRPDIIHAHFVFWAGICAEKLSKTFHIPYVITEHGSVYARDKRSLKFALARGVFQNCAAAIAVSERLRDDIYQKTKTAKRFLIVPNTVDTEFFSLPPGRHGDRNPFTFFALSNLFAHKALDFLLHSFHRARQHVPHARLLIGGDGPERAKLRGLCRQLGLDDSVEFLGILGRQETKEVLAKTHVFAHPSDVETFGVVIIEAMACGIPVVSTKCGGPEEILDEDCGILVDKRDQEQFAAALVNVHHRFASYDPAAIRRKVLRRYSLDVVGRRLLDIYQGVTGH